MIDVLCIPGTGEASSPDGRPVGMIKDVARFLPKGQFDCWQLDYPRSYGPLPFIFGVSFEESVKQGVSNAIAWIRASKNPVGLIGYSQGSTVVTIILEMVQSGELPDIEIAFAGLIANPNREPGHSMDWACTGFGIMGDHDEWPTSFPIWELANPKDPIACLDGNSPLRDFYSITKRFSISDPISWGFDLLAVAQANQRWWELPVIGQWRRALEDAKNYVFKGEHVMYNNPERHFPGTTRSYAAQLAWVITEEFA